MTVRYLKEITDWSDNQHDYEVKNHTYIVDGQWCYGYIKTKTKEEIMFSKRKWFDRARRRFVELKR